MTKRTSSVDRQFAAAAKLAARFPGIEVSTSYGTPAIKVKGKFMARLRTEAEGWLAIKCDFIDREVLLQAAPHVFHLTPHYQNYPMILVDLATIDEGGARRSARARVAHDRHREGRSRLGRAARFRRGQAAAAAQAAYTQEASGWPLGSTRWTRHNSSRRI